MWTVWHFFGVKVLQNMLISTRLEVSLSTLTLDLYIAFDNRWLGFIVTQRMYWTERGNLNNVKNPISCFPASWHLTEKRLQMQNLPGQNTISGDRTWYSFSGDVVHSLNSLPMSLEAHHSFDILLIFFARVRSVPDET